MATVRFSHVSKVYLSGAEAVKNFNLDIGDGEFITIVGPSGCGKSTILRMAAGLEEITTGELYINDKVVNEEEPKKRNVAMVFQNYALFPNLTVAENMEFALKMQGMPKKERRAKAEAMAKVLGIEDILDQKAKRLSGGQCQRIAIGRALVCEPNLFLLDEPLSNLDASMRNDLRVEIADLQRRLKITTLYVTHDQTEAMTLGDRVVVMKGGEVQQVDTPQNLYCRPQTVFVARFLGAANFNLLKGVCEKRGGEYILDVDGVPISLPDWKGEVLEERLHLGKPILAGIRAEDCHIVPRSGEASAADGPVAEVRIESVDVLGAEMRLHLRLGEQALVALTRTTADLQTGDSVTLSLDSEQFHLFDAETEMAIVH